MINMIVETVQIGNATIHVHDDFFKDKTRKQMQECIDNCCRVQLEAMLRGKEKTA